MLEAKMLEAKMMDLVVAINDEVRDLFPEVEWQRYEDIWVAKVDHEVAAEMQKVIKEAGLSVGEVDRRQ